MCSFGDPFKPPKSTTTSQAKANEPLGAGPLGSDRPTPVSTELRTRLPLLRRRQGPAWDCVKQASSITHPCLSHSGGVGIAASAFTGHVSAEYRHAAASLPCATCGPSLIPLLASEGPFFGSFFFPVIHASVWVWLFRNRCDDAPLTHRLAKRVQSRCQGRRTKLFCPLGPYVY